VSPAHGARAGDLLSDASMTPAEKPAPRPRSLLPQEHGAWGQLAMPLLSALLLSSPSPAALLLAAATVFGFLSHEPWLVTIGHRGARAMAEDGVRAGHHLKRWLALAALCGAAGFWLAPWPARYALFVPALLVAVVIGFVLAKQERTVPGELAVVSALASSGFAVALASGSPLAAAAAATTTWMLAFATSVFAVQVVLVRALSRGEDEHRWRNGVLVVLVALAGSSTAVAAGLGRVVPVALAPTAALSLAVCLLPFSARQLRTLGWGLVAATTATLVLLVAGLRAGW
jgi:hypothetical protein